MNHTNSDTQLFVVGIGASVGGLRALENFFEHMPSNSGAAFVVVQHLSPDFKSLMKELLERRTNMEVHRTQDGLALQPNHIYLIPPRQNLVVRDGHLHLLDKPDLPRGQPNFPINLFFESLAKAYGEQAIGLVMSGTGSDGSFGLEAISEAGGLALVQSPDTAEFDGMPQSALSTGIVDQALPPRELAQFVADFVQRGGQGYPLADGEPLSELDHQRLQAILTALADNENDLDFSYYKISTLTRRCFRRCTMAGYDDIDEYIEYLKTSSEERRLLKSDLLINVTRFFRDPKAWNYLETQIFPDMITQMTQPDAAFRVWVAACATGEEAYSMAMMLDSVMEIMGRSIPIKIFATDVDAYALQKASNGVYPETITTDVPDNYLNKYFRWRGGNFHVKQNIREKIIFAPHNLIKNAGFTQMNLVSCRNVLIYMRSQQQQRVLHTLHFSLAAKGILFLGESETTGSISEEFTPLNERLKVFQKRRDIRLPILSPMTNSRFSQDSYSMPPRRNKVFEDSSQSLINPMLQQTLAEMYASRHATCVFLDRNAQVLHIVADGANILQVPRGRMTNRITAMLPPQLHVPVSTALNRAHRSPGESITYTDIAIEPSAGNRRLRVTVTYSEEQRHSDSFNRLVIEESGIVQSLQSSGTTFQVSEETNQRMLELEYELQQSRENLQTTIEELETTNKEQQATNEELLASNEELQSTNEELHSVNEELYTVNAEYQSKIVQLTELNNDIDNLLKSTDIGVIFLDSDLHVRKFTQVSTQVINLVESDIERPLEHITHNLDCENLIHLLRQVLNREEALEREVRLTTTGEYLLMRIHPYRNDKNRVDGIVLTFVKITDLKNAEQKLAVVLDLLETTYETTPVGLCLQDADLRFVRINSALAAINGLPIEAHIGKTTREILPDLAETLEPILRQVIETGEALTNIQIKGTTPADPDRIRHWMASYYPVRDGVGIVVTEITELKKAQAALDKSESLFRLTLEQSDIMVFTQDLDLVYQWVYNPIAGFSAADFLGKTDRDIFSDPNVPQLIAAKQQVLAEQTRQTLQFHLRQAERDRYFNFKLEPFLDTDGNLAGIAGVTYEVTDETHTILALANANEQAQTASHAKSQFLAAMSHELRTPLNAILGLTETMQEGILGEVSDRQLKAIRTIETSGTHLLNLINDILDISKVEAGRLEPDWGAVSVSELCHRSLELVAQQAQRKQIVITLNRPDSVPNLWGDARRLRQVLLNLLDNAVKFTHEGGQVTLAVQLDGDRIMLSVTDTGIGIAENDIPKLFQPFTQVDSTLSRQYDGTGLGLALTEQLIKLHNGEIYCTSTLGVGSCFTVVLPILADIDRAHSKPAATLTSDTDSPSDAAPPVAIAKDEVLVLLAEDNETNIETTTSYLEAKGYRLIVARDGGEAVAMASAEHPDVILMDIQMPEVDGLTAIQRIRQQERLSQTPIIALTALAMDGDRDRCLQAGANAYMSKPVRLKALADKIQECLAEAIAESDA
jgi:two-component system CheB/CheR fusion protein